MELGEILLAVAKLLLVLIALGLGTVQGVEVIKAVAKLFGGLKDDAKKAIGDYGPLIASVAVMVLGSVQFDVNVLELVDGLGFEMIESELAVYLTGLLGSLFANKLYDNFVKK